MVRRYTPEPVDPSAVDRIIEAAGRGPSAGFSQGVEFIVVKSSATRMALADAAGESAYIERGFEPWLSAAPVHVIVTVDPDAYHQRYGEPDKAASRPIEEWDTPYWWVDAGAALTLLLLAVTNEGLAAGFLGSHAFADLGSVVGIPDRFKTIGLVTIGHEAASDPVGSARRRRRPRHETEHAESWHPPRDAQES